MTIARFKGRLRSDIKIWLLLTAQFSDLQEAIDMAIMWDTTIKIFGSDNEVKEAAICKQKTTLPEQREQWEQQEEKHKQCVELLEPHVNEPQHAGNPKQQSLKSDLNNQNHA